MPAITVGMWMRLGKLASKSRVVGRLGSARKRLVSRRHANARMDRAGLAAPQNCGQRDEWEDACKAGAVSAGSCRGVQCTSSVCCVPTAHHTVRLALRQTDRQTGLCDCTVTCTVSELKCNGDAS